MVIWELDSVLKSVGGKKRPIPQLRTRSASPTTSAEDIKISRRGFGLVPSSTCDRHGARASLRPGCSALRATSERLAKRAKHSAGKNLQICLFFVSGSCRVSCGTMQYRRLKQQQLFLFSTAQVPLVYKKVAVFVMSVSFQKKPGSCLSTKLPLPRHLFIARSGLATSGCGPLFRSMSFSFGPYPV